MFLMEYVAVMHHWRIARFVVQDYFFVYDIHETEWSVSRAERVIRKRP